MEGAEHCICLRSPDVAATRFTHEPGFERLDGLDPPSKEIEAPSAALAETPPFAHQCSIAKECRLDREHIESRHVTSRIAAFEYEVLHREFGHAPGSQLPKRPSN
jgi:hypothetical protein